MFEHELERARQEVASGKEYLPPTFTEPCITSGDRFADLQKYLDDMLFDEPHKWGSIMPWEFPQNGSRELEEAFLRNIFGEKEIHIQGGLTGEGSGYKFLKQAFYCVAIFNSDYRLPQIADWWLCQPDVPDLLSTPLVLQAILSPNAQPQAFFGPPEIQVYGLPLLQRVVGLIQSKVRHRTAAHKPDQPFAGVHQTVKQSATDAQPLSQLGEVSRTKKHPGHYSRGSNTSAASVEVDFVQPDDQHPVVSDQGSGTTRKRDFKRLIMLERGVVQEGSPASTKSAPAGAPFQQIYTNPIVDNSMYHGQDAPQDFPPTLRHPDGEVKFGDIALPPAGWSLLSHRRTSRDQQHCVPLDWQHKTPEERLQPGVPRYGYATHGNILEYPMPPAESIASTSATVPSITTTSPVEPQVVQFPMHQSRFIPQPFPVYQDEPMPPPGLMLHQDNFMPQHDFTYPGSYSSHHPHAQFRGSSGHHSARAGRRGSRGDRGQYMGQGNWRNTSSRGSYGSESGNFNFHHNVRPPQVEHGYPSGNYNYHPNAGAGRDHMAHDRNFMQAEVDPAQGQPARRSFSTPMSSDVHTSVAPPYRSARSGEYRPLGPNDVSRYFIGADRRDVIRLVVFGTADISDQEISDFFYYGIGERPITVSKAVRRYENSDSAMTFVKFSSHDVARRGLKLSCTLCNGIEVGVQVAKEYWDDQQFHRALHEARVAESRSIHATMTAPTAASGIYVPPTQRNVNQHHLPSDQSSLYYDGTAVGHPYATHSPSLIPLDSRPHETKPDLPEQTGETQKKGGKKNKGKARDKGTGTHQTLNTKSIADSALHKEDTPSAVIDPTAIPSDVSRSILVRDPHKQIDTTSETIDVVPNVKIEPEETYKQPVNSTKSTERDLTAAVDAGHLEKVKIKGQPTNAHSTHAKATAKHKTGNVDSASGPPVLPPTHEHTAEPSQQNKPFVTAVPSIAVVATEGAQHPTDILQTDHAEREEPPIIFESSPMQAQDSGIGSDIVEAAEIIELKTPNKTSSDVTGEITTAPSAESTTANTTQTEAESPTHVTIITAKRKDIVSVFTDQKPDDVARSVSVVESKETEKPKGPSHTESLSMFGKKQTKQKKKKDFKGKDTIKKKPTELNTSRASSGVDDSVQAASQPTAPTQTLSKTSSSKTKSGESKQKTRAPVPVVVDEAVRTSQAAKAVTEIQSTATGLGSIFDIFRGRSTSTNTHPNEAQPFMSPEKRQDIPSSDIKEGVSDEESLFVGDTSDPAVVHDDFLKEASGEDQSPIILTPSTDGLPCEPTNDEINHDTTATMPQTAIMQDSTNYSVSQGNHEQDALTSWHREQQEKSDQTTVSTDSYEKLTAIDDHDKGLHAQDNVDNASAQQDLDGDNHSDTSHTMSAHSRLSTPSPVFTNVRTHLRMPTQPHLLNTPPPRNIHRRRPRHTAPTASGSALYVSSVSEPPAEGDVQPGGRTRQTQQLPFINVNIDSSILGDGDRIIIIGPDDSDAEDDEQARSRMLGQIFVPMSAIPLAGSGSASPDDHTFDEVHQAGSSDSTELLDVDHD